MGDMKYPGWFAAAAEPDLASRRPRLPQLHPGVEQHGEPGIGFPSGNLGSDSGMLPVTQKASDMSCQLSEPQPPHL